MANRSERKRAKIRRREFVNAISSERDFLKNLELKKNTSYTNIKVRISEGQKDKLKKAFESNRNSSYVTDLNGEDVIAITTSQLGRLDKAYEANKSMTIKMSRRQLA